MNERRVTIACGELELEGMLAKPEGEPPIRVAVICHPHPLFGGSMHDKVVELARDELCKLGFARLRFNFRGVGASSGAYAAGVGEVEDAQRCGKRIILIAGDRDVYCPQAAISKLAKLLGNKASLELIVGADHFFRGAEKQLSAALARLVGAA